MRRAEGSDAGRWRLLLANLRSGGAGAEDYPTRPIRVVVGFGPGAVADVILRVMASRMSQTARPAIGGGEPARAPARASAPNTSRARRRTATRC